MGWRGIESAPRTGQWVWGEWPAILSGGGAVLHPRIVGPMRWGRTRETVEHWQFEGKTTYGADPVRWAPMGAPPDEQDVDVEFIGEPGKGAWLVALRPGQEPVIKRSFPDTAAGKDAVMSELVRMVGEYTGATLVRLDDSGDLLFEDPRGSMILTAPYPAEGRARGDESPVGG